jgi:hypothetical protein
MTDEQQAARDAFHIAGGLGGYVAMAAGARLLWHRRLVRLGHRRFWSWDLAWELPTAALSAVIGGGLAEYMSLDGLPAYALVGIVSWLGPRGMETALARFLK